MTARTKKIIYNPTTDVSAAVSGDWQESLTKYSDAPAKQTVYVSLGVSTSTAGAGTVDIQISPSNIDYSNTDDVIYTVAQLTVPAVGAITTVIDIDTPCDRVRVIKSASTSAVANLKVILFG